MSLSPPGSTASTVKTEKVVPPLNEDGQQQPPVHAEATRTDEEYAWWVEVLLLRSLFTRGPVPPSPLHDYCVKEELSFPPCHRVKKETVSPLRPRVKTEASSCPRNQHGCFCHGKEVAPQPL